MDNGYYWVRIKHTGDIEVVELHSGTYRNGRPFTYLFRAGEEQLLELDQVEIIERVAEPGAFTANENRQNGQH